MPEGEDPQGSEGLTPETATGAALAATLAQPAPVVDPLALPADLVRQTPEYQALQEQARASARNAGNYRAEAERLRQQQEADRQAAEAQRTAALQQAMLDALGDQAQDFGQFAELLQTDPVAAARAWSQRGTAQSPPAAVPVVPAAPQPGGQQVPSAPQPPSMGVSASAPLGQTQQQSEDDRLAALDRDVANVVAANQGLSTRARVTDRIRAEAMGKFLRSSYIRGIGVDPDLTLNQRG